MSGCVWDLDGESTVTLLICVSALFFVLFLLFLFQALRLIQPSHTWPYNSRYSPRGSLMVVFASLWVPLVLTWLSLPASDKSSASPCDFLHICVKHARPTCIPYQMCGTPPYSAERPPADLDQRHRGAVGTKTSCWQIKIRLNPSQSCSKFFMSVQG